MTQNQKKVHAFVMKNPEATYDQISDGTGIGKSSVQMAILSLEKKKLIVKVKARWMPLS